MKKTLILIVVFSLVLITFTGCSEKSYLFKEPIDEIESIEIVSAENSLDYTVIKTLSESEKNDFLEKFQDMKFRNYLGDPSEIYGDTIKITYKSGVYEMICPFVTADVENGIRQLRGRSCDEEVFNNLLDDFLSDK